MIPKILHYVWLGNKPKPHDVKKCLQSWLRFCPDFEIKEWNDESVKNIDCDYLKEAIEHKKWAFASDVVRLYALREFGGFYLDTDAELTDGLESFLDLDFVIGFEKFRDRYTIGTAFIGSIPGHKIVSDQYESYQRRHFVKGSKLDKTTNTRRFADYFRKEYGINTKDGRFPIDLSDRDKIFPAYYFCCSEPGKKNYCIHHFNGSWFEDYDRFPLFSFGCLQLVKIKQNRSIPRTPFPIKANEKKIFQYQYHNGLSFIILVWETRS